MQILVNGVDRTGPVDLDTLRVDLALGSRAAASFTVKDKMNLFGAFFPIGAPVAMSHEGSNVFGGSIDRPAETKVPAAVSRYRRIECTDNHHIADRHQVAEVYDSQLVGDAVRDIVTKYVAADGVTVGEVQDGPIVTRAIFNYVSATQALQELADLVGFIWWIDADKKLYFVDRATYAAPWTLDDPAYVNNLKITESREQYRNRQYIRGGQDITDVLTERPAPKPDGQTRTFTLKYPVAKTPVVKVNGVAQTVGIRGVDTGKQWCWSKGDRTITQDDGETALASTDVLEVIYQGLFPIIAVAEEPVAIAERKTVEGGSGIYEAVEDRPEIDKAEAALQYAQGALRKYATIPKILTFETRKPGLRPGQILTVNLSTRDLAGDYLIQSVSFSRVAGSTWLYDVTAVSGETVGGWAQFFQALIRKGRIFAIRENEVLVKLLVLKDLVLCGDSITISTGAPESRVGYAMIGYAEVA